jgi:DNA (cytosine-5)-methyltransferase 1
MNVLDLFSGIGGFSLGLERAGMRTVAFCETEPFCRRVLAHHWPDVPIYDDVRALTGDRLRADGISVDVICGGFPCQDISAASAGKAKGLAGERSGLWFEMARLIRELRPSWVVVENVPRLRTLGVDRVLDDLEDAGYAPAPPMVVGAVHAGAPHLRRRVWIVAHAQSLVGRRMDATSRHWPEAPGGATRSVTDTDGQPVRIEPRRSGWPDGANSPVAANDGADANSEGKLAGTINGEVAWLEEPSTSRPGPWEVGPFDGDEVVDGLPSDMDHALRAYGNSVLPQIPEALGRAIMSASHLFNIRRSSE